MRKEPARILFLIFDKLHANLNFLDELFAICFTTRTICFVSLNFLVFELGVLDNMILK